MKIAYDCQQQIGTGFSDIIRKYLTVHGMNFVFGANSYRDCIGFYLGVVYFKHSVLL